MPIFDLESIPTRPIEGYQAISSDLDVVWGRVAVAAVRPLFAAAVIVPTGASDTVASRFHSLAKEWVEDTALTSSMDEIVESEPYRAIIEMGDSVVPLILEDLKTSPKHWFSALNEITNADPVPADAAGNLLAMAQAWLGWGRELGYID
jgi:hypothetical protein